MEYEEEKEVDGKEVVRRNMWVRNKLRIIRLEQKVSILSNNNNIRLSFPSSLNQSPSGYSGCGLK